MRTYITHSVLGIDSHELGIYVRTYITHSVLGIDSHEVDIYVRTYITDSVLGIDSRIISACTGKYWWKHDQTLTLCGASSGS